MLRSPIFNINHSGLTFDFEEFIKNELGLKLDNQVKREGNLTLPVLINVSRTRLIME